MFMITGPGTPLIYKRLQTFRKTWSTFFPVVPSHPDFQDSNSYCLAWPTNIRIILVPDPQFLNQIGLDPHVQI